MRSERGQTDEPQTPAQDLAKGIREPLPKWGIICLVILNYFMQLLVLAVEVAWVAITVSCIAMYGMYYQALAWVGAIGLLVGLWILNRIWLSIYNQKIPRYKTAHKAKTQVKKRG